jgi:predicted nuclease of predicted toxin-antitoxin system
MGKNTILMKFIVDANLPFKLAIRLRQLGFDVIHTDNLPNKEKTSDKEIRQVSIEQNRVVITKDSDFLDSHLIQGIPSRLIFVTTGNIANRDLLNIIEKYFETMIKLLEIYDLIEINNDEIIGHEK